MRTITRGGNSCSLRIPGGRYGITARLFSLIGNLPKDQQLILLKQMVGDKVTEHLFKLIVEMTEDQQLIFWSRWAILWNPSRREDRQLGRHRTEHARKPTQILSHQRQLPYQGKQFPELHLDISIGGVFIETNERIPAGETIVLNFTLPNLTQPFFHDGKNRLERPPGFGVKVRNPLPAAGQGHQIVY